MVSLSGCFWWRFWAGCWCHQLHEVLTATGLRGTGHHSLFATQQAHLGTGTEQELGWAGLGQAQVPIAPGQTLTVVERLGPCQQPVPCSYFMALNLS